KIKDRDRRKYAKRGRAFYLKAAALMICLLAAAGMAASLIMYEYREHFVDYCDPDIQKKLMEEYHFTPQARLNGSGTLYIEKDEDLYCTRTGAEYPWMFQKDRIKKIVFGENVTGLDWNKGDGSEDVFIYAEDKELQYYGNMPHYNPRYVSEDLFRYCRNLEEISFQGSSFLFNTLDPFRGNDSLKAVSCSPDTLVEIASNGDNPFLDTPWIRLDGFCTAGATLFRYNGSEKYMNDFPENITRIENGAFQDNKEVEVVFLPEGVRIIGANAFSGCSALKQVEFPEGLMEIRRGAFEKCSSLIELQLPSGIETIEYSAFR
ncbi:MAG: leucine-rich repeat domain-containing protein, partial [Blautia sp.]|nr:leucine-rich repeat domain-containing protein [Blautia sp.]